MQTRMKIVAGVCVAALAFAGLTAGAQQRKAGPAKKPVVVKKTTTVTTKTTKVTTTTKVTKVKPKSKRHHVRHRARHHRRVRRRGRRVHVTTRTSFSISSGAETSLVGIHIFDPGTKVIALYGNPAEIQNMSGAAGNAPAGPAGGGGGRPGPGGPGGPAGGPGGRAGGGGRGRAGAGAADVELPDAIRNWSFENDTLMRAQGGQGGATPGQGSSTSTISTASDAESSGGPPYFVRWVYKKAPSQYSFIIDKNDRVVQIEAVGMGDPRVHTSRGVAFGSTFGQIINKYHTPDAYEISGDNIVLRYLTKNKVAFRLNRLQKDKPHVVTAIVVAGGKM